MTDLQTEKLEIKKIAAVISEFNPFHPGHSYIAEKARELTGADVVIALMSGNFVQRGEPAVFDMGVRTEAALSNGYDIVFELPPQFALSSAEGFAGGAVNILDSLGVDFLVFGSECGDLQKLKAAADILADESDAYKTALRDSLKAGNSFPSARESAVFACFSASSDLSAAELHEILHNPNNILAVEYLKALRSGGSGITPFTVQRINSSYHAGKDNVKCEEFAYSAESIRKILSSGLTDPGREIMPEYIVKAVKTHGTVCCDSLTPLLLYKLLSDELEISLDKAAVPEDLSRRIVNNRNFSGSFSEFCELIKTKNITYTAVSRHLLHIILDMDYRSVSLCPDHIRLLGFTGRGEKGLSALKTRSKLTILSNSSDINAYLKNDGGSIAPEQTAFLKTSLRIDQSYNILRDSKKRKEHPLPPEISRRMVRGNQSQ
ncbi:MAG: nucleotidyltransferase family protein [Lachnospiraceae bacterium]|nr:nucleotidyltransferase family protein [Lachnospiraceae bacterium]